MSNNHITKKIKQYLIAHPKTLKLESGMVIEVIPILFLSKMQNPITTIMEI